MNISKISNCNFGATLTQQSINYLKEYKGYKNQEECDEYLQAVKNIKNAINTDHDDVNFKIEKNAYGYATSINISNDKASFKMCIHGSRNKNLTEVLNSSARIIKRCEEKFVEAFYQAIGEKNDPNDFNSPL